MKEWLDELYETINKKVTEIDEKCMKSDMLDERASLRKQANMLDSILSILVDFDEK
jgi:hypothetical protein